MTGSAAASSPSCAQQRAPYRLVVAEATIDDGSVCALHPATMTKLSVVHGDVVLLKSKHRRETLCVAVSDEECKEHKLKINRAVRSSLRVGPKSVVFVQVQGCADEKAEHGKRPVDGATGAVSGSRFRACLKPFKEHRFLTMFILLIISLYLFRL